MFFTLGASVTPRINWSAAGKTVWIKTAESVEFRWECGSGQIVYRGQQITAVAGNELELVLPEKLNDIFNADVFADVLPGSRKAGSAELLSLPCGRAPPEFLLTGEQIV